jgi:hypothetical protein
MDIVQTSVIFDHRLKGHGYKRIHVKLAATSGGKVSIEDSVNHWFRESNCERRDLTDLSKTVRPPSDIEEAASKVVSEQSFSSPKHIAALAPDKSGIREENSHRSFKNEKCQFPMDLP